MDGAQEPGNEVTWPVSAVPERFLFLENYNQSSREFEGARICFFLSETSTAGDVPFELRIRRPESRWCHFPPWASEGIKIIYNTESLNFLFFKWLAHGILMISKLVLAPPTRTQWTVSVPLIPIHMLKP